MHVVEDEILNNNGIGEKRKDNNKDLKESVKSDKKNVYEVRCKETWAEFYHDKFVSGNKGQCILFQGAWMTPKIFEEVR